MGGYPKSHAKDGSLMPVDVHRTLIVELYKHKKPIAVPEYTHEAIVTVGSDKQYFYGHSDEEVLAKILTRRLEKDHER